MTSAHAPIPLVNDPTQVLDIIFRLCHRLKDDLGVTIAFDDLPPETIADWHSGDRTLTVRRNCSVEEQYHVYRGLLDLLVIGPRAVPGAVPLRPRLRAVPSPRQASDAECLPRTQAVHRGVMSTVE